VEWSKNYYLSEFVLYASGVIIGLINGWIVSIFAITGKFEKRETVNEEI